MATTNDLKNGLTLNLDGQLWTVVDFQHVKPGKGGAFVRTKLKHLKLGTVVDRTFRSGEKFERVDFEQQPMQFLYRDDLFHFMNLETYEQIALSRVQVGEAADYLKDNMEVEVVYINGQPSAVELPTFAELRVVKTDPGVRGDTASGGSKPATLETGAVVSVPLFINEGDLLKIDTRTGAYIERAG